ncbi:hypothetical protein ACVR0S_01910 [Streptococcus dentapri]|uniref:Uncharacterized protein n=1 Tax=Streptococcus dentapri TaxID=573564 RepID=A0ABV8D266_9STRE
MATLVRVHGQGIDQLQLDEVELRELASNEVRMTVKASRITGDQLNYIKGLRLPGEAIHEISSLGYEAAGIVTAIGKAGELMKNGLVSELCLLDRMILNVIQVWEMILLFQPIVWLRFQIR